ncbi:hypothetical protein BH11BAC5_BH11BAC5_38430 [soil metagenome]
MGDIKKAYSHFVFSGGAVRNDRPAVGTEGQTALNCDR